MTQKQIQTTLLDRLESVDLRGTLLFTKAKRSKNFCVVSHFVRIYCFGYFATLRFAQYDGVGRGFAQGVVE